LAVLGVDADNVLQIGLAVKEVAFQIIIVCWHVIQATDKIVAVFAVIRTRDGVITQL